ncbi:MAG: quinolinate synthase NadA, partial [Anaerolineales bacterium]|nr:quinolinate synthase NadA [Anaerolineales bacterium]
DVRQLKAMFPGVPVVTYVNTYADVKAESDICCTSGNAHAVVESLGTDTVIFLPDEYLAGNVARETGKHIIFPTKSPKFSQAQAPFVVGTSVPGFGAGRNEFRAPTTNLSRNLHYDIPLDYQMVGWHGRCEVHEKFTVQDIQAVRAQFPEVVILSHPECSPEVVAASDYSGSTTGMIRFVEQTHAPQYLLLTECAMGDNIAAENPDKDMLRLCSVRCPHMNQITLEDTLDALKYNQYEVHVPEEIRVRAARAVERMIAIG